MINKTCVSVGIRGSQHTRLTSTMRIRSIAFSILLLMMAHSSLADDKIYSFAVVPQRPSSELAAQWLPFLEWVSAKSGVQLRFVTAPDIPTFEKKLAEGEYDLAYMNPYHYTVFHKKSGYEALAREKGRTLKGILVVRKDSSIKEIKQLEGMELAFPAPGSFAASILPRVALRQLGINVIPKFVKSHESVYLNVEQRHYAAGGGIESTFDTTDKSIKNNLRVLWSTKEFTPHAIASHPRLPKAIAKKIQETLVDMANSNEGRQQLSSVNFKEIEAAKDADWNDIRRLKISEVDVRAE